MDKLEEDWNGLKLCVFENLLAWQFFKVYFYCLQRLIKCSGDSFVFREAVILLFTISFFTNAEVHGE